MKKLSLLLLTCFLVPACGGYGGSGGSGGDGGGGPSTPLATPTPTPGVDPGQKIIDGLKTLDLRGKISGGVNDQRTVLELEPETGVVTLRVLVAKSLDTGAGSIPGVPGATFTIGNDSDGKGLVTLQLPIQRLVDGTNPGAPAGLPGGQDIPGVPEGKLPHTTVTAPVAGLNLEFYLGTGRLGVFAATPGFDPFVNMGWNVKNQTENKVIGAAGVAKAANPTPGGFFTAFILDDPTTQFLKDLLK